jgi:hypothetical protein
MKFSSLVPSVLAAAGVAVTASMMPAEAATFGFQKITNNNVEDLSSQLSIDVTEIGSGQVQFKYTNNGSISSNIAEIYVDGGVGILSASPTVVNFPGTNFSLGANPNALPGGNSVNVTDNKFNDYAADNGSDGTGGANNNNEMVALNFNLVGGQDFDDVLGAITGGQLKFGAHIRSIGVADGSDSYVNTPNMITPPPTEPVPEPLTILGSATALGIGGLLKRQQSKKNNKA